MVLLGRLVLLVLRSAWRSPDRRCPLPPHYTRPVSHYLAVDGAGYTVVQLHVDLGEDVTLVDALFSDISQSSSLHYVPGENVVSGTAYLTKSIN